MTTTLTRVELSLDAETMYVILDELYQGAYNSPEKLMDTILLLESALEDNGLPVNRDDYEDDSYLSHPENEQYKRITYWLNAERKDKQ